VLAVKVGVAMMLGMVDEDEKPETLFGVMVEMGREKSKYLNEKECLQSNCGDILVVGKIVRMG